VKAAAQKCKERSGLASMAAVDGVYAWELVCLEPVGR
jgi:hypothetical protein